MSNNRNIISLVRSLLTAGFILSAAAIGLAAMGLRPAARALSQHYRKQPIALRKPLAELDISRLLSFKTGWLRSDIPPDDIETEEYAIIRLTAEDSPGGPQEVVLFVTYYSDPKSKVPHTPDVCYRQGGAIVKAMKNVTIDIPGLGLRPKVRLLLIQQERYNQALIFCFYADGEFRNSREQVRWAIGKPGNRHVYFSKIETVAGYPIDADPGPAVEICKKLFAEAAPILVAEHFPTIEQVRR